MYVKYKGIVLKSADIIIQGGKDTKLQKQIRQKMRVKFIKKLGHINMFIKFKRGKQKYYPVEELWVIQKLGRWLGLAKLNM